MIQHISIQPNEVRFWQEICIPAEGPLRGFPMLSIDTDSYIVQVDIQTGIDLDPSSGRQCIAIGKGCSIADQVTFMIDLDHNFGAVAQGELLFLKEVVPPRVTRRKASIIIQNDVWVGHGATIMAGVTLHNGCVVAAGTVVTKDVPPYAIVGGNPARILRYRFNEETVVALQHIAWWDWPEQIQNERKNDFSLPVQEFVRKYLPKGNRMSEHTPSLQMPDDRVCVLFVPDVEAAHPLYPKVLKQYLEKDRPHTELLIYLPEKVSGLQGQKRIEKILEQAEDRDSYVTLQTGEDLDEHMLFQMADYFVTTRSRETVHRTCLADLYGAKLLYGTDEPIFPADLC